MDAEHGDASGNKTEQYLVIKKSGSVSCCPNLFTQGWQALDAMKKVVRMTKMAKTLCAFIVLVLPAYLSYAEPASTISVDLAKKCRELAVNAYPSPTAGSKASGAEKAQRDYYQACIAKGIAGAHAQSTGNTSGTGMGGTAATGTGVKTGHGPLSQPIPPAVSTTNPRQNPQRPQNMQGPAQTNPPQEPFGSR